MSYYYVWNILKWHSNNINNIKRTTKQHLNSTEKLYLRVSIPLQYYAGLELYGFADLFLINLR